METYLNKINYIEKLLIEEKMQLAEEKLKDLKNAIIYDVAIKKCKNKNNKKKQLQSAKELLNNSKDINKHRILFHKIYKINDTYQLCDGFTAIVLKDMIEGLELNTAEGEYMDCRKIINCCNPTGYEYEEVNINILDLEQKAIAVKKEKCITPPPEYQVHINNLYYNPVYLLRAIRILGTDNIKSYVHYKGDSQPIYLKSELGEAVILPIKQPNKKEMEK